MRFGSPWRRTSRSRAARCRSTVRRPAATEVRAALREAVRSRPSGRRKDTDPLEAFWARVSRSGASPRRRASHTGVVTPCSRPTLPRTASTRWLTHGTFSWSAPDSPARRRVARSTETVVWLLARSTTGLPALRARVRARRTTAGSSSRRAGRRGDTASTYQDPGSICGHLGLWREDLRGEPPGRHPTPWSSASARSTRCAMSNVESTSRRKAQPARGQLRRVGVASARPAPRRGRRGGPRRGRAGSTPSATARRPSS